MNHNHTISIIAAIQKKDRGIGYKNQLLVRIPADLKRFRNLTIGHPVIMGRKTFESIKKALSDRTNIVVTRNISFRADGIIVKHSFEHALQKAEDIACHETFCNETFILGGAEIYTQALPLAHRLYLTIVDSAMPADAFFPEYEKDFEIVSKEDHIDETTNIPYSFVTLERKNTVKNES